MHSSANDRATFALSDMVTVANPVYKLIMALRASGYFEFLLDKTVELGKKVGRNVSSLHRMRLNLKEEGSIRMLSVLTHFWC